MSVIQYRKSWWVNISLAGTRYRRRCPDNSKRGALAYEVVLRGRLARGEPIDGIAKLQAKAPAPTFNDFAQKWFNVYVVANNRFAEQRSKRYRLNKHLLPAFGAKRIDQITALDIEEYKSAKRNAGTQDKTLNNHLTILSRCLNSAREWDVIDKVPKIKWYPVDKTGRVDFLLREESDRLLAAAASEPFWYRMILTALRTGLRLGELIGLEWGDIDLDSGQLTVARSVVLGIAALPKSKKTKYVPIASDLAACLAAARQPAGLVFPRARGGYLTYCGVRKALNRVIGRAGLRHFGWHTLRHTFASQLVKRGIHLVAVQKLMRHETIEMTLRYSHLAQEDVDASVEVLTTPLGFALSRETGAVRTTATLLPTNAALPADVAA